MTNINKIITKFAAALVCATAFSGIHCAEEFSTDGTKKDDRRTSSDFSAKNAAEVVNENRISVSDRSAAFKKDDSPNKPNFVTPSQLLRAELEEQKRKAEQQLKEKEEETRKALVAASNLATQDAKDAIKAEEQERLLNSLLEKSIVTTTSLKGTYDTYSYVSRLLPAGSEAYQKWQKAILDEQQLQQKLEAAKKTTLKKRNQAAKSSHLLPVGWNATLERESIMKELSEAFDTASVSNIPVAKVIENTKS